MKRDTLYAETNATPGSFRFDEAVVSVFPDMIRRSVPGYEATLALTGRLAARYAQDYSAVVDLGCSLGDSLLACAQALEGRPVTLLGVDNAAPMIAQAEARFAALALTPRPRFEHADLLALAYPPATSSSSIGPSIPPPGGPSPLMALFCHAAPRRPGVAKNSRPGPGGGRPAGDASPGAGPPRAAPRRKSRRAASLETVLMQETSGSSGPPSPSRLH